MAQILYQSTIDLGGDHNRVYTKMRLRRVRSTADDLNVEAIGRCHDRPRLDTNLANRQRWPVMEAVQCIDPLRL